MNEAMSEAVLQAALKDIRLPPTAPGGSLADLMAALALSCLAALAVAAVLRLATRAKSSARGLSQDLDALRQLPDDRRRVALLHLLKTQAPERFARLRDALYRPDGLSLAAIEDEVRRDG